MAFKMKAGKKGPFYKNFPDLNKDGEITRADILMGAGAFKKIDDKLSIKAVEKHEGHAAKNPVDTTGLHSFNINQAKIIKSKSDSLDRVSQEKIAKLKNVRKNQRASYVYQGGPGESFVTPGQKYKKDNPVGPRKKSGAFYKKGKKY